MLAALILAAREPHRVRMLLIGFAVLVPFQTFSVVSDFLKNVGILAGPAVLCVTAGPNTRADASKPDAIVGAAAPLRCAACRRGG